MQHFYTSDNKDNQYFEHIRTDAIDFICDYYQSNQSFPKIVLELGSGSGIVGKILKTKLAISQYVGLELVAWAAQEAQKNIDISICGNIETMLNETPVPSFLQQKYDAIIALDVLEHLQDPWAVVDKLSGLLTPNGVFITSIPNAGNFYVIQKLLTDKFEYEERGLLDKTHLRFFTLHTIQNLFKKNYAITKMSTVIRQKNSFLTKRLPFYYLMRFFSKRLLIVQYLIIAQKKND